MTFLIEPLSFSMKTLGAIIISQVFASTQKKIIHKMDSGESTRISTEDILAGLPTVPSQTTGTHKLHLSGKHWS